MANDHIPSSEIRKDIADTEAEIAVMEREEAGLRLIGDRWSVMRADSRLIGVRERREFISKLRDILYQRGE